MHSLNRKNVGRRLTQILSAFFVLAVFGAVGCEYHYPGEGITESQVIDRGDGTTVPVGDDATLPETIDGTVVPASPDVAPDSPEGPPPMATVCGNGTCEAGETTASCTADCPAAPPPAATICGNGTCEAGETTASCASDCPVVPPPPPGGSGSPCTTAETNAAFCTRLTKNCGSVTANDNCGTSRTVASCGTCSSGQTCGAMTPNVCGSPRYEANVAFVVNSWVAYEAEDCTPPTYSDSDGRVAVPLVITVHAHGLDSSPKAQFVMNTAYVELNDAISSIEIKKGPNYVEGDKVWFFEAGSYLGRTIELGPGDYRNINMLLPTPEGGYVNLNDEIASLQIVRSGEAGSKQCADGPTGGHSWTQPIHLIVEEYQNNGFDRERQQFIEDHDDLRVWSANDDIDSVKIFKGPHYQAGDNARFYPNSNGGGVAFTLLYGQDQPELGSLEDVFDSIHFFDVNGNRIYGDED